MTPGDTAAKPSRAPDARSLRSRKALRQALLSLLEHKSFEQISIRDLTAAANVSYPVFFRQFSSTEQLLAEIAKEEIAGLMALPFLEIQETSRSICGYVHQHRTIWKALLKSGASPVMRSEFIHAAIEISTARGRVTPWLPVDLTAAVTVSAMFEILAWWLVQPDDYPIERIARILEVLVLEPVIRPQPLNL